jgi:hypothetical protein
MKLSIFTAGLVLAFSMSALAAEQPPTTDQAKKDVKSQKQDPLAIQSSGSEDWTMLAGHEKGFVEKKDALPNSWLAQNFSRCDEDQNGKVSEQEYQKCQSKMH